MALRKRSPPKESLRRSCAEPANAKESARMKSSSKAWMILLLGLSFVSSASSSGLHLEHLRCEYLENPLGIDAAHPHLSWVLQSEERGQKQTSYEILAGPTKASLTANDA